MYDYNKKLGRNFKYYLYDKELVFMVEKLNIVEFYVVFFGSGNLKVLKFIVVSLIVIDN